MGWVQLGVSLGKAKWSEVQWCRGSGERVNGERCDEMSWVDLDRSEAVIELGGLGCGEVGWSEAG